MREAPSLLRSNPGFHVMRLRRGTASVPALMFRPLGDGEAAAKRGQRGESELPRLKRRQAEFTASG